MLRIGCVTGRKWVREACGLALPRTRRPSVPPGRLKPPFSVSEASDEASVRSFSSSVKRTRKKSPGQVRLKNEPLCRVAAVVDYGNPMQNLVLGTGVLATQCDGAAVGRQGGCLVLGTAVSDRQAPAGAGDDFLPLVVEYREKAHAFGRINRSVNRREGAQSDQEILASRVIDRVIRPLFPEGFIYDTQVVTTVESSDRQNDLTVLSVNTASAALAVSNIPWNGPVGCVRVGMTPSGKLLINPTEDEMQESDLNLLYAGNEQRTLMIEAGGSQVPELEMIRALKFAHFHCGAIIKAQQQLAVQVGSPKRVVPPILPSSAMWDLAHAVGYQKAVDLFSDTKLTKSDRSRAEAVLHGEIRTAVKEAFPDCHDLAPAICSDKILRHGLRDAAVNNHSRCDGRKFMELRRISSAADVMPSVHGSSIFTRGDTQVLCAVTLGSEDDAIKARYTDDDEVPGKKAFLHYDFPPYSVNETGKVFGSNRRMVGHGALAERAILPVLPSSDDFPYTIRITSEVTASNGSSSMASACAASLALMDAGVPVKAPVAGVSVGLLSQPEDESETLTETGNSDDEELCTTSSQTREECNLEKEESVHAEDQDGRQKVPGGKRGKAQLLVDILGTEDHFGDMDFKVAGTLDGITAIQLDIKLAGGVPPDILVDAIHVAARARRQILGFMGKTITEPRARLKDSAPGMEVVKYSFDQHKDIFTLENRRLVEDEYNVRLSFPERGKVTVFGRDPKKVLEAHRHVQELVADIQEGEVYMATVVEVKDFGAVLEVLRGKEGLLHMSEISHHKGSRSTAEMLAVGQQVKVQCATVDRTRGLIKLSRKALLDPGEPDDLHPDLSAAGVLPKVPVPPGTYFTHMDMRKARMRREAAVSEDKENSGLKKDVKKNGDVTRKRSPRKPIKDDDKRSSLLVLDGESLPRKTSLSASSENQGKTRQKRAVRSRSSRKKDVNVINAPEDSGSPVKAEGNGTLENMSKSMPSIPESLSSEVEGVPRKTISSTDLKSEDLA
ncbi:polyribonucleotide nucleotidyltransferase 1 [Nannochloropsis gaditana]|uniref:polyribonucleotide nucleotidyltransferase n=2 Tax=Nannochloropsis gaditana TaxID=72520 RepID=W7U3F1_9STRA|nr:polyribonucleotide nucleotidyltransferase 1 [Nannochloropsis gaditana]